MNTHMKKTVLVHIYIYLIYGLSNIEISNPWPTIESFDISKGFRALLIKFEI